MKKSLKVFLIILCLLPIVLLSACGITQYYTITVTTSEKLFGTVNGGSDVAKAEGTSITLSANELKPDTNPFICWIKDNKKVVSFEKTYSTTYSKETNGKYTALFQETSINKTRYATITNIQVENAENAQVQIFYSYSNSSSVNLELENLQLTNGSIETDKTNLLYFGSADGETGKVEFSFRAIIKVTNGTAVTEYPVMLFDNILVDIDNSKAGTGKYVTFDENGNITLQSKSVGNNIKVNITLSKVNSGLYEQEENIGNN